jgi:hypothetical protein
VGPEPVGESEGQGAGVTAKRERGGRCADCRRSQMLMEFEGVEMCAHCIERLGGLPV